MRQSTPQKWNLVRVASIAALLVAAHASVLRADPVLVSDERFVLAFARTDTMSQLIREDPAVPFGPFDATASASQAVDDSTARASAFQNSTVTPTRFTGAGILDAFAEANGEGVGAAANSAFAIVFDLTSPFRYRFLGDFSREGNGFTEFETAFAGEGPLASSGLLQPGRHTFYISVLTEAFPGDDGVAHARGAYDVDLRLEPVPEPASLLLLLAGLGSAAFGTRVRRGAARGRAA